MDTILSFILRNLRSSQRKQPTGHTVSKETPRELGMSSERSQTSYHSMQQNDGSPAKTSDTRSFERFLLDKQRQRELKAWLMAKHRRPDKRSPDTVEERCLLWQREAFRRS